MYKGMPPQNVYTHMLRLFHGLDHFPLAIKECMFLGAEDRTVARVTMTTTIGG